jgi:hypothetical protein
MENYKSKSGKKYANDLYRDQAREWLESQAIKLLVCFRLDLTPDGRAELECDGIRP